MCQRLGLVVLVWLAALCAPVEAAISRVGSCAAQTTSCTFSVAPTALDAIIVFAHKDGATSASTLPTGYELLNSAGVSLNSGTLAVRISDGTETTTGTWTGATSIAAVIYRGANVAPLGNLANGGAASATIAYNTFTLDVTTGTSWVVGFAGHRSATNVNQAPTGMTLVASATDIAVSDTNAGVSSWSTQSVSVNASSGWESFAVELLAQTGEDTTKLYVDDYVNMDSADANTSVLSATVMTNGTRGPDTTYSTFANNVSGNPTGFTVNTDFINAPGTVRVRSTSTDYAPGSTSRGMYYDDSVHFTWVESDNLFANRHRGAVSVAGYITLGAPNDGASGDLYDLVRVDTINGNFCVMQLNNGDGGAGYHLRIESNPSPTGTQQSPNITPTPGSTYWYSLLCNFQSGVAKLAIYDTSKVQVGSTVTGNLAYTQSDLGTSGAYIEAIKWGNLETKTDTATNKFEHLIIDYSAATFPLGPVVTTTGGCSRTLLKVGC